MNKSTKFLACLSTALLLGGGGVGTYYGMRYYRLNNDHDKYVQEATLRDEEAKKKQEELENKILIEGSKIAPIKAELERLENENANLTAEKERLNSVNESLKMLVKDASSYSNLVFSYNEADKTATVRGADAGITNLEIPSLVKNNNEIFTVTSIEDEAFTMLDIQTLVIPDSVTSIGMAAFGSGKFNSVSLPKNITEIPVSCFGGCTALKSITLPEDVTSIGENAFNYCTSLTSITLPEGLTTIGDYAFSDCSGLTSLTLPSSVTSVGASAFYRSGLTSITIPASVTEIGESGLCDLTNVIFEDPNGWKVINMVGEETNLEASALSEENISQTLEKYKFCSWAKTEA